MECPNDVHMHLQNAVSDRTWMHFVTFRGWRYSFPVSSIHAFLIGPLTCSTSFISSFYALHIFSCIRSCNIVSRKSRDVMAHVVLFNSYVYHEFSLSLTALVSNYVNDIDGRFRCRPDWTTVSNSELQQNWFPRWFLHSAVLLFALYKYNIVQ